MEAKHTWLTRKSKPHWFLHLVKQYPLQRTLNRFIHDVSCLVSCMCFLTIYGEFTQLTSFFTVCECFMIWLIITRLETSSLHQRDVSEEGMSTFIHLSSVLNIMAYSLPTDPHTKVQRQINVCIVTTSSQIPWLMTLDYVVDFFLLLNSIITQSIFEHQWIADQS